MLDGTRDHVTLAGELAIAAGDGRLGFLRDGQPVTDPAAIVDVAAQHLPALLAGVANAGLLEA